MPMDNKTRILLAWEGTLSLTVPTSFDIVSADLQIFVSDVNCEKDNMGLG